MTEFCLEGKNKNAPARSRGIALVIYCSGLSFVFINIPGSFVGFL